MPKKILVIKQNDNFDLVDCAVDVMAAASKDVYPISVTSIPLCDVTCECCKSYDGVLVGDLSNEQSDCIKNLKNQLALYAGVKKYRIKNDKEILLITNSVGVTHQESGIRQGSIGLEAYETGAYPAIEMENVLRIAFEYANEHGSKLALVDNGIGNISQLFRSVASEIIQEYAEVNFFAMTLDECLKEIFNSNDGLVIVAIGHVSYALATLLTNLSYGPSMVANLSVSRTAFALGEVSVDKKQSLPTIYQNPIGIILATAMLIRRAFDQEELAVKIENAVKKYLNSSNKKPLVISDDSQTDLATATEVADMIKALL